jgi:HEAT repeat protein
VFTVFRPAKTFGPPEGDFSMARSLMNARFFMSFPFFVPVVALFPLAPACTAQEPKKADAFPKTEIAKGYEEIILTYFKRSTDTASLVAYLKEHSSSDDDLLAIPDLIKELGGDQFTKREAALKKLVAIGLPALMPLLDATHDKDPERAKQATTALAKMDRGTHTVSVPAVTVRLLIKRKPPGLLETLLRYLPFTTDPEVEEDLYDGIDALAVKDGRIDPQLVKALDDTLPARRALGACIIARAGNAEQQNAARKLLKDSDANVRLRAAQGFLAGLQKTSIPTLVDLLDDKSLFIAWQAEELLVWAACDSVPKERIMSGGTQATKAKVAWQTWWNNNEAKVDLQKAAKQERGPWILIGKDGACIVGSDGQCHWQLAPESVQSSQFLLMRNNRLIGLQAEHNGTLEHNLFFSELNFDGSTLRKVKLTSARGFPDVHLIQPALSANGIVRYFSTSHFASVGIEGRLMGRVAVAQAAQHRGRAAPYSCTDGLVWVFLLSADSEIAMALMDPEMGTIVHRWIVSKYKELSKIGMAYAFSRGRLLMVGMDAIWSYDFETLKCIHRFESPDELGHLLHGISTLRGNRFGVYSGSFNVYSADWKVLSTVTCARGFILGPINHLMPVVGFGFR